MCVYLSCRNSQSCAVIGAGVCLLAVLHELLDVSDARQDLVPHRHHLLIARESAGCFDGAASAFGLRVALALIICVKRSKVKHVPPPHTPI